MYTRWIHREANRLHEKIYAEAIVDAMSDVTDAAESLEADIRQWMSNQNQKEPACDFCGIEPHDLNKIIRSRISHVYVGSHCIMDLGLKMEEIEYILNIASPSSYEH